MKIYLDTCCYNRQFDDQSQGIVKLETDAINLILQKIAGGDISLVWSETLDDEIKKNKIEERKKEIAVWKAVASEYVVRSENIYSPAMSLMTHGIKEFDAYHVASADAANCDYFITVDIRLLKRAKSLGLPVLNPLEFVEVLGGIENGTGIK